MCVCVCVGGGGSIFDIASNIEKYNFCISFVFWKLHKKFTWLKSEGSKFTWLKLYAYTLLNRFNLLSTIVTALNLLNLQLTFAFWKKITYLI